MSNKRTPCHKQLHQRR